MFRTAALLTAAFVVLSPTNGFSQVAGIGLTGLNGGGSQLGPPPAGVMLHQQYMQLYGLPVNFTQGQTSNGGGQAPIIGGYGGYPGGGGRFYGVNYQRNMMAAQAYMAAMRHQQYMQAYGLNGMNAPAPAQQPSAAGGSFGMSQSRGPNPFAGTFSSQEPTETRFRGFGFAGQQSFSTLAPLTNRDEDKKEEKKESK
jgi:hypothetical protein